MKPEVRVGVACFVWKDGQFLMGQRKGSHGADTWSVPGGHLELNESWEDAAKREVMEETSLEIQNIRFLAATNDLMLRDGKHYVSIWMQAEWKSGEPIITEPEKYLNLQWSTFKTLPTPLFEPCWQNLRQAKPELFR